MPVARTAPRKSPCDAGSKVKFPEMLSAATASGTEEITSGFPIDRRQRLACGKPP